MDEQTVTNFLKSALEGLSQENFDAFVRIFLREYKGYDDAVNVNGPYDGGRDFLGYKDKKERKKYIQVTVQKNEVEKKLKSDLKKVSERIETEDFSKSFEFYCSQPISQSRIEDLKKFASDEYDINLEIYDSRRLSQINCEGTKNFIYEKHGILIEPEKISFDKNTQAMFDILSKGNATYDIKYGMLVSMLILTLFDMGQTRVSTLQEEVENKIGMRIPDILEKVNKLKTEKRVLNIDKSKKIIALSDDERNKVKRIIENSLLTQATFRKELEEIMGEFGLPFKEEFIAILQSLYQKYYNIAEGPNNVYTERKNHVAEIERYIEKHKSKNIDSQTFINHVWDLCKRNGYLNQVCAGKTFLDLYKSHKTG